jgi:hypothetical protein
MQERYGDIEQAISGSGAAPELNPDKSQAAELVERLTYPQQREGEP